VEAGRIEAEFVPLDVVRWSQVSVSLNDVESLESLGDAFRNAVDGLLSGAADRLHALRVRLTGSTKLHSIEANRPGTLEAAIRASAQDINDAEIWVEQVRIELTSPLDRTQAAHRDDAIGELVRLVDTIAGDMATLSEFAGTELGDILNSLPAEVVAEDIPRLNDTDGLRALLHDAEATVLARLVEAVGSGQ
jgi:hypothetical protein